MATRNSRKIYVENGYYHVYNRGVDKRIIYQDDNDYAVFLSYLKECLSPPPDPLKIKRSIILQDQVFKGIPRQRNNYYKSIDLVCYCLMPNHFHLLIKQYDKNKMTQFIHSLLLRYTIYFNKKHNREGRLYQGRYKAIHIANDSYLLHLSRYIHTNPLELENSKDLENAHSSYADFLGLKKSVWVKPEVITNFFKYKPGPFSNNTYTYKNFVENSPNNSGQILGDVTLE